jgi:hypothetical protein
MVVLVIFVYYFGSCFKSIYFLALYMEILYFYSL